MRAPVIVKLLVLCVYRELCAKACVVIGTAAQNNETCQHACQPALGQLINLCKSSDDSLVKVKSLFAVSCEPATPHCDVIVDFYCRHCKGIPPCNG